MKEERPMRHAVTLSVAMMMLSAVCCAQTTRPADEAEPADPSKVKLPGIEINAKDKYIDVDGVIAAREAFLELVACTEGSKEHESIVSMRAKAQHLHLALMLLGAKPGRPGRWVYDEEAKKWKGIDPTGTAVKVTLMVKEKGKWVEKPLSRYIIDKQDKPLPDSKFIFGGSIIKQTDDGRKVYEADAEGNAIALVAFGDATLCWPEATSDSNEELEYYANTKNLPKENTAVKLRLRPDVKR
jgi:hypothetical protein